MEISIALPVRPEANIARVKQGAEFTNTNTEQPLTHLPSVQIDQLERDSLKHGLFGIWRGRNNNLTVEASVRILRQKRPCLAVL
jgi:hypothetical protein